MERYILLNVIIEIQEQNNDRSTCIFSSQLDNRDASVTYFCGRAYFLLL